MAEIKVGKNETLDSALRRFKRATQKACRCQLKIS